MINTVDFITRFVMIYEFIIYYFNDVCTIITRVQKFRIYVDN